MKSQGYSDFKELAEQRALLAALSGDLSLPFLQIKTTLELLEKEDPETFPQHHQTMGLSAQTGLQLIEAYQLALLAENNAALALEPVAIGAVLQDVAQQLTTYAKRYDTQLDIAITGKLRPVLAHRASLQAALQCLSSSLIRAQAANPSDHRHQIVLAAHRAQDNLVAAGVFSNVQGLSDKALRTARSLVGRARQPINGMPVGAASGILIADMLCSVMWQPLRAAAYNHMHGLVTAVPLSKQMKFI